MLLLEQNEVVLSLCHRSFNLHDHPTLVGFCFSLSVDIGRTLFVPIIKLNNNLSGSLQMSPPLGTVAAI